MNQKQKAPAQVPYLGRNVSKIHFRAYVYSKNGEEKFLANSWDEFNTLVKAGEWLEEKPKLEIENKIKPKKV